MQVGVIPSHGWGPNRNQLLSITAPLIQNNRGRRGPRGAGRDTLAAGRGAEASGPYEVLFNFRSCLLTGNVKVKAKIAIIKFFLNFK
jgi:hypothetical protein